MPNKDTFIPILLGRYIMAVQLMLQTKTHYLDGDDNLRLASMPVLLPSFFETKPGLAMGLWLGSLYVVVEGWKATKCSDSRIDELLTSRNVDDLRRFRNWLFHFQTKYVDERYTMLTKSPDVIDWAVTLMGEFERYFLTEMRRINTLSK